MLGYTGKTLVWWEIGEKGCHALLVGTPCPTFQPGVNIGDACSCWVPVAAKVI